MMEAALRPEAAMARDSRHGFTPLALAAALALAACTADEPPPRTHDLAVKREAQVWPDWSPPQRDLIGPNPDLAPGSDGGHDGAPSDGGPADAPSCPGPAAAKCTSACASDESCTEASGGTCVKSLVITGAATDKAALKAVALAYVACWNKAPADDTLCFAFNTCAMTGALTDKAVSDWVCNQAQVSDFPTSAEYDAARGLCECSWWQGQFIYRPDWKIGSIISGKKGNVCLSYDKNPWYAFDKLNVNDCQYFPPQ